ncbi:hypothetical protein J2Y69_001567 [Microbacterium resistens]|uniref:Uncharacterized protein n=1 Tax=Microbacterium resistens TaxID=156977 RepID=A0ABU1SBH6_9MICO|nr:daptide biosynthesis RiPP recognition protein [Microbacterium resistens]MDR6866968.1 hypothetical protein [Microbacterium resistens]
MQEPSDDDTGRVTGASPATSHARAISSAVFQWATGLREDGAGRVVFSGTREGLPALARLAGPNGAVLLPSDGALEDWRLPSGVRVLSYEGELAVPGDVMHIGRGYEIELQDYLALPFVPVTRSTVVRCLSAEGWAAFAADADEARATGLLIPQLTSRSVVLADRAVIDAAVRGVDVEVNSLTVDDRGEIRRWPVGPPVAADDDALLAPQPARAYFSCFADGGPETVGGPETDGGPETVGGGPLATEALIVERPWLPRYLTALRVAGGEDGETWSLSGFGGTLTGADPDPRARPTGDLLIWRGDEYQLVAGDSGRRFSLGRDTALVVECLLGAATEDDARAAFADAGIAGGADVGGGIGRDIADLRARFAAAGVLLGPDGETR